MNGNKAYRKSTRSGGSGGNCVEWAHTAEGVYVRDSKDPQGPELRLTPAEWEDLQRAAVAAIPHRWIINSPTGVRLSKDGKSLSFTTPEWNAFQAGILAGECQPTPATR